MKANSLLAVSVALTASTVAAVPLGIPLGNGKFVHPVNPFGIIDKRLVVSIDEFNGKFPLGVGPELSNLPIANEKRAPVQVGQFDDPSKQRFDFIDVEPTFSHSLSEKRTPVQVGQFDDPSKQGSFRTFWGKRDAARIGEFDDILRKPFIKIDDGAVGVKREAELLFPGEFKDSSYFNRIINGGEEKRSSDLLFPGEFKDPSYFERIIKAANSKRSPQLFPGEFKDPSWFQGKFSTNVKKEAEAEPFVLLPGMEAPEACTTASKIPGLNIVCL